LYLPDECKQAYSNYLSNPTNFELLNECIDFLGQQYMEINYFDDECIFKFKKAEERYYNKTYDAQKVKNLKKKIYNFPDVPLEDKKELFFELSKIFNFKRPTTHNLCDCFSISLYTPIDPETGEINFNKLLMYLFSIYISIITVTTNSDFVLRLYFDVGTIKILLDCINKTIYDVQLNQILSQIDKDTVLKNLKIQLKSIVKTIFTLPNLEPHIIMCKKQMRDQKYIIGRLRLYRYTGFMDQTVRINAAREADGHISIIDCKNLAFFAKSENYMYNLTPHLLTNNWYGGEIESKWIEAYEDILLSEDPAYKTPLYDIYDKSCILHPLWAGCISFGFQLNDSLVKSECEKINKMLESRINQKPAHKIQLFHKIDALSNTIIENLTENSKDLIEESLLYYIMIYNFFGQYKKLIGTDTISEPTTEMKETKVKETTVKEIITKNIGILFEKYEFSEITIDKSKFDDDYMNSISASIVKIIDWCKQNEHDDEIKQLADFTRRKVARRDIFFINIGFDEILLFNIFKPVIFIKNSDNLPKLHNHITYSYNLSQFSEKSNIYVINHKSIDDKFKLNPSTDLNLTSLNSISNYLHVIEIMTKIAKETDKPVFILFQLGGRLLKKLILIDIFPIIWEVRIIHHIISMDEEYLKLINLLTDGNYKTDDSLDTQELQVGCLN
jgi:hypothetical protein